MLSRSKIQRFSLLLLSEGEYVFDDFRGSRTIKGKTKLEKGSLKVCSHSLMFVPDDVSVPLTRSTLLTTLLARGCLYVAHIPLILPSPPGIHWQTSHSSSQEAVQRRFT